ncbi:unnamed protein product [Meganyctiphanes norvegica]|uniref:Eukaryotic elongation factor 2 kinase n=1 Tax=Meganyctiphanes norvegica TaxID=48144 RepID=A0AAV2RFM7_MEGNR
MSFVSETGSTKSRVNSTSHESMSDVEEGEESATAAIRHHHKRRARNRYFSECSDGSNGGDGVCGEHERLFVEKMASKARPSNISGEVQRERTNSINSIIGKSILGQIHLDLANYHEVNRFVCGSENFDVGAAFFHLEASAECGILEATITMARLHLGLPHDILPHINFGDECNLNKGFAYLETAAEAGDRAAMVYMAEALRTGFGLPNQCSPNWALAVRWYEEAVYLEETDSDGNFDGTMDHPRHQLVATQAHMFLTGGHGLVQHTKKAGELFTWAAELATEAMKGKLAAKYYMQAEEAWAQIPEE